MQLRQDQRVRLLEKTNARYLTREQLRETVDLIAIDVAFISATLVLPAVVEAAFPTGSERDGRELIILVKPQFEAGREKVGKGSGLLRPKALAAALAYIRADPRIWEVILSGGDPLVLSARRLAAAAWRKYGQAPCGYGPVTPPKPVI